MKLINRLDEAEISNIAEEISTGSKDFVLLLRNEYKLESVLDVIQTWSLTLDHNADRLPYRTQRQPTQQQCVLAKTIEVMVYLTLA
jgi:hypothetical protein